MEDKVYNSPDTAEQLGISKDTLRSWRVIGKGPEYFRQGCRVYYRESAIQNYLNSLPSFTSTSSEAAQ